jgi:voltage-gated potassium channel
MNRAVQRVLSALLLLATVILLGGAGYFDLGGGRWTFSESLYMSIITVSTVGFAELPGLERVAGARILTTFVILGGIGAVAYFQSTLTALLVEGAIGAAWRRTRMRKTIESLSNHVVVAGIGSTGRHVVEELHATSTPFVAIERNREHLARVNEEVTGGKMLYIHGDATEDEILRDAGVERAMGVVAALSDDKDNLFVTLSARSMNPKARIVARVVGAEVIPKMSRAGANATVSPNMIGGRRMASELIRPEVTEFLDEMLRDKERNLRLEELVIASDSPYAGHALREAPLRRETNVLVVAVREADRRFRYNPGPDHVLAPGTVLVVLGETRDIQKLRGLLRAATA